jgi:vacuolar-type H+-ATPase subunit H
MREIVDEVLSAEKKAEDLIQEAKKQAAEIRNQAETLVAERVKEARDRARELVRTRVEEAEQKAEQKYSQVIGDARKAGQEHLKENAKEMDTAVEELVRLIIQPQQERR